MVIALAGLLGFSLLAVVTAQSEPGSPAEPATATVEVTVWRRVSDPSLLYLSTRPEGGSWQTQDRALDMSRLSTSRSFHQSSAVLVEVPLPGATPAATCVFTEQIARVSAATFQVQNADGSSGTAFYIGDGEWITNHHVVEDSSTVLLVHDQSRLSAQVVGTLPAYDLALLSARPGEEISPLAFVSERPALASFVTIVGFPYGVVDTPSVARGIVSKHLPFTQLQGFASDGVAIQFDAAGNPGNSGGPIVDDCATVVGVVFGGIEETPSGRDVDGVEFGIAAETVIAQLANLRSSVHNPGDTPQGDSSLTISAFCTYWSSEDLDAEECDRRASNLDTVYDRWNVWAQGVVDFDNVLYRFDGGASLFRADVREALLALGAGCHELEIAENGISTHWSGSYEFCFVDSTPAPATSTLAAPTGLRVQKVDIPLAPDDIDVHWNAVAGATWYELWYHDGVQWQLKATTTRSAYRDESPSWLFADSYTLRACNSAGCSAFSAVATQY